MQSNNFNLWYGDHHALKDINLDMKENEVTAIIGPSGCGKSTYIKALNRMVELVPMSGHTGEINYRDVIFLSWVMKWKKLVRKVRDGFPKAKSIPKIDL